MQPASQFVWIGTGNGLFCGVALEPSKYILQSLRAFTDATVQARVTMTNHEVEESDSETLSRLDSLPHHGVFLCLLWRHNVEQLQGMFMRHPQQLLGCFRAFISQLLE